MAGPHAAGRRGWSVRGDPVLASDATTLCQGPGGISDRPAHRRGAVHLAGGEAAEEDGRGGDARLSSARRPRPPSPGLAWRAAEGVEPGADPGALDALRPFPCHLRA